MPQIGRPEAEADWEAMRAICAETSARPVPAESRPGFGRTWIDPYRRWAGDWAYIARNQGTVVGYLTGCPSTAAFLARALLFGPCPPFGANLHFPKTLLARLLVRFPAHLHVNVLQGHRGGTGRALIASFEHDLIRAGVPGAHVFCGPGPIGFYLKLGYAELGRLSAGGRDVFALGKRLDDGSAS